MLYVPNFKFNLLSVAKLTKELKCIANFFPDFCVYQDLWNGKVKGIGRERGGLYMLRGLLNRTKALNAVNKTNRDTIEVWHNRLGHPSASVMKHIVGLNNKNSNMLHANCLICPLAKQTILKFPFSNSRVKVAFHLVHMNLWGPYKIVTFDKKQYFLTIVDDYSRYTLVLFLQLKSEAVVAIKNFIAMVQNQFGIVIKVIRSDNGSEFLMLTVQSC